MNKHILKTAGLTAIVMTTACTESFPAYSSDENGPYQLAKVITSNSEFIGEKFWPCEMEVVHRKEHDTNMHHIGIKFLPCNTNEAQGELMFNIYNLTLNNKLKNIGNDLPDGVRIYSEKMNEGNGVPWCESQVQYWASATFDPHQNIAKDIYDVHVEILKAKNNSEMDQEVSTKFPEDIELDEDAMDKWDNELANNIIVDENGYEINDIAFIKLRILRHRYFETSGCYKWGGYLPPDEWGSVYTEALYYAKDLDYSEDLRDAGISDVQAYNGSSFSFINQIMPDVKKLTE